MTTINKLVFNVVLSQYDLLCWQTESHRNIKNPLWGVQTVCFISHLTVTTENNCHVRHLRLRGMKRSRTSSCGREGHTQRQMRTIKKHNKLQHAY